MANSRSGDSMIERLVRILAAFDDAHTELSGAELARRTQLSPSTAHRIAADLIAAGLLERHDDGLRIGLRLWELTTRGSRALGLRQAAMPYMRQVQNRVRQHTQLGVLEHHEVLFLERLSDPDAGANITRVAGRLPAHASSSGLALLAHADPAVREAVLAGPLPALAQLTPADPAALRRKLAEVRRLGYAEAPGSIEAVSTGIAVPVRADARPAAPVIAALGVVLPRNPATGATLGRAAALDALREAVDGLEGALGARAPFH